MFTERRVTVSTDPDVTLFVADSARSGGRTLLVVHGGPDWDHSYLREPLVDLADEHHLILPDLRGCGRSTVGLDDHHYTPDAVVRDLIGLLDTLGVEQADVLGFSYGGLIAQRLAVAAPHRVSRLILASTSVLPVPADAFDGWTERDRRRVAEEAIWSNPTLSGPALTLAAAIASAPADVWRHDVLPAYIARLHRIRFTAEWMRPWRAGTLPSARHENAVQLLACLEIPILLLHGRQDMTFPVSLVDQTLPLIPTARAAIIDDAGHMAHIDQPGHWLTAVRQFI